MPLGAILLIARVWHHPNWRVKPLRDKETLKVQPLWLAGIRTRIMHCIRSSGWAEPSQQVLSCKCAAGATNSWVQRAMHASVDRHDRSGAARKEHGVAALNIQNMHGSHGGAPVQVD